MSVRFLLSGWWCLVAIGANAADLEPAVATLISDQQAVEAGKTFNVALHLQIQKGWHVYWSNPGDSGLATKVTWLKNDGAEISDLRWPIPQKIVHAPFVSYGYENEVVLPMRAKVKENQKNRLTLQAKASWVVCKEQCLSKQRELILELPVKAKSETHPERAKIMQSWYARLPTLLAAQALHISKVGQDYVFRIAQTALPKSLIVKKQTLAYYPSLEGVIDDIKNQPVKYDGEFLLLRVPIDAERDLKVEKLSGLLVVGTSGSEFKDVLVK